MSIKQLTNEYDVAVLSAWRRELKDVTNRTLLNSSCTDFKEPSDEPEKPLRGVLFDHENQFRNRGLKAALLLLHYGVINIRGNYIKDYNSKYDWHHTDKESFFVVNLNNDPTFFQNIFKLSEYYNQDSFIYRRKDSEKGFFVGTNITYPFGSFFCGIHIIDKIEKINKPIPRFSQDIEKEVTVVCTVMDKFQLQTFDRTRTIEGKRGVVFCGEPVLKSAGIDPTDYW